MEIRLFNFEKIREIPNRRKKIPAYDSNLDGKIDKGFIFSNTKRESINGIAMANNNRIEEIIRYFLFCFFDIKINERYITKEVKRRIMVKDRLKFL